MLESFKGGHKLDIKYAWPLIKEAKALFSKEETLQVTCVRCPSIAPIIYICQTLCLPLSQQGTLWWPGLENIFIRSQSYEWAVTNQTKSEPLDEEKDRSECSFYTPFLEFRRLQRTTH